MHRPSTITSSLPSSSSFKIKIPLAFSLRRWMLAGSTSTATATSTTRRRQLSSSSSAARANTNTNRNQSQSQNRNQNPYPFPRSSPDPTPYQIFHLMPDASPNDIKHRYYELVRLYHPDAAESRRYEPDAARRHAVFSAITRAYAQLQKGDAGTGAGGEWGDASEGGFARGVAHRWRRAPTVGRRRYEEPRFMDERWKDRIIWGVLGFSFVTVAAQTIVVRRQKIDEFSEQVRLAEGLRAQSSMSTPLRTQTQAQARGRQSEDDALLLQKPT